MKNKINTSICFLLIIINVFANVSWVKSQSVDEPFSSYGKVSWKKEIVYLDNYAIHLRMNPETIGYITYYVAEKDSSKEIKNRVNRAVKYLTQVRKVDRNRLVIIYGGKFDKTITVLKIQDKDLPPPHNK